MPDNNSTVVLTTAYCRSGSAPASAFLLTSIDALTGRIVWSSQILQHSQPVPGLRDVVLLPFPQFGLAAAYDPIGGTAAAVNASDGSTLWVTNVKAQYNCQGTMLPARNVPAPQPPLHGFRSTGIEDIPTTIAGEGNILLGCVASSGSDSLWIAAAAVSVQSGFLVWRTDLSAHFPRSAGFGGAALAGYTDYGNSVIEVYNQQGAGDGVVVLNANNGDVIAMQTLDEGFELHGAVPQWNSPGALAVTATSFASNVCANQVLGLKDSAKLSLTWSSRMTNDSLPAKYNDASCGGHLFGRLNSFSEWGEVYVQWDSASASPGNFSVNRVRIVGKLGQSVAELNLGSITPTSAQLGANTMLGFNNKAAFLAIGPNITSWPWHVFTNED